MTDKQPYTPLPTTQAPTLDQLSRSHAGRLRHRTVVFIAVAVLLLVCFQWHKQSREFVPGVWEDEKGDGVMRGKKVGVELFVMSKCPDAVKCEEVFGNVLAKVSSITNITTTYIGQENEDAEYGATCKHGDGECLGAIHQLCIRDTYPDPYNWYNYILCVNQQNRLIPDWGQAERCAEVVGLLKSGKKWEKVQECVDGKRGRELLGRSVGRVAEMGVRTSCTIFIDGEKRCVHDGGWVEEQCPGGHGLGDFIGNICDAYKQAESVAPRACKRDFVA